MISDNTIFIIGSTLGFMTFLISITTMEGVLYRPNSKGDREFTLEIVKNYLLAPFDIGTPKFDTVWGNLKNLTFSDRMKLLQFNWIAMTSIGISGAALVVLLKHMLIDQ